MKSTEPLDTAGKSVDLSSATGETAVSGDSSISENKRRRLVRGAVALAPLVLTLRSGALAAASCTGVKIARVDSKGGIVDGGNLGLQPGDKCVKPGILEACPSPDKPNKVLTSPVERSHLASVQTVQENGSEVWVCGNSRRFKGKQIAILSSTSVTSMMG